MFQLIGFLLVIIKNVIVMLFGKSGACYSQWTLKNNFHGVMCKKKKKKKKKP